MKIPFQLDRVIKDFVFLFFFIGFFRLFAAKEFTLETQVKLISEKLNIKSLTVLANAVAIR